MGTKDIIEFLGIVVKREVLKISELEEIQEIRLRINKPMEIILNNRDVLTSYICTEEDLRNIIQKISNYSVYAFEEEFKYGYITIKGGHRIGLCGDCVIENGQIKTIKNIASINMRVCREVINCSKNIIEYIAENDNLLNTILISPPKCGKTTMLRDIARTLSNGDNSLKLRGRKVSIIDERSEIGACYLGVPQLNVGVRTDIYDGCIKSQGIMMAIRALSPEVIICDEIGTEKDIESILLAMNSGVNVVTSIHGFGVEDFLNKKVFYNAIENRVFKRAIVLSNRNGVGTIEDVYDFHTEKSLRGEIR